MRSIQDYYNRGSKFTKEELREKQRLARRKYYLKNKEELLKWHKVYWRKYYLKNKEKVLEKNKKWKKNNRERVNETNKLWIKNNKERHLKRVRPYERKKYREDVNYKIAFNLRRRLNAALSGKYKGISAVRDLGISIKELKLYLGKKFYPHPLTGEKMTWDNYGYYGWHIDHKIPCSSFDFLDPEQQKKCFHYTNLQPLWAIDNIKKGKKIISGDITSPKM